MSAPPTLPQPVDVAGPSAGLRFLKDVTAGGLLLLALSVVTWFWSPSVSVTEAPPSELEPIVSNEAQPKSLSADEPVSDESVASMPPSLADNRSAATDVSPDGPPTDTASLDGTPSVAAVTSPAADTIAAAPTETVSKPEDRAIVERARKDLLVAVAPTIPIERARRPAPVTDRKVEFFSVKSKAQTVAFVVDCSSSMDGAKFAACKLELLRAIVQLQADQAFYVIFFNEGPVYLPGQAGTAPTWATARSWVKHQTGMRLAQMDSAGGTDPEQSLNIAAQINPDVIYLLTDGGFSPLSRQTYADLQQRKIQVNTIGFMDRSGEGNLRDISNATNGTYQFVPNLPDPRLAGKLKSQMAALLLADARTADANELDYIHGALVDFAQHNHGPLRLADIDRSLVPWRKWYLEVIAEQWAALPPTEIATNFNSGTVDEKIAAMKVVRKFRYEALIPECIAGLSHGDSEVRQSAREALKELSGGYDWGPQPDTGDAVAMAAEVANWERWQRMRSMVNVLSRGKANDMKTAAADTNVDRRWAAAIAMGREQKIPVEWLLIPLTDADPLVRDAAVKSLQARSRQLKNSDLGPELKNQPGRYLIDEILDLLKNSDPQIAASGEQALIALATPEESFAAEITGESGPGAGTDWNAWWIRRKDQPARKALELAKTLLELKNPATREKNREAAAKRLREIISHYPGTPSAKTAERLLMTD